MQVASQIHLSDVQAVYSGAEGRLWELLMGEQIHIGGLQSSTDLADRARIGEGSRGLDLCCCTGAGMRFLLRFRKVAHMTGVDATPGVLQLGRQRAAEEGFTDRIAFVEADARATGLPGGQFDFLWGEDAWCYVEEKPRLIAEAARLVQPGGTIAFTDWMLGSVVMSPEEAERYLPFMKFPSVLTLREYSDLLESQGCSVQVAHDTGRFSQWMPLYIDMIERQLTYDALKITGFDVTLAQASLEGMHFVRSLAEAGKVIQGLIVARKEA